MCWGQASFFATPSPSAVLQAASLAFSNAATSLACAGRATKAFAVGRMGSLMGAIVIHHF